MTVKNKSSPPRESRSAGGNGHSEGFAELWRPEQEADTSAGPEQILLESGVITARQLERAVKGRRDAPGMSIMEVLVNSEVIDEIQALKAMAEYFDLPFMRLTAAEVDERLLKSLPLDYLKNKQIVPVKSSDDDEDSDDGTVTVGVADPADVFLIDDIKNRLAGIGCDNVRLVVVPPADIRKSIDESVEDPSEQVEKIIQDVTEDAVEVVESSEEEVTDLEKIAGESPVIRYVNYLIFSAAKEDASDIHIEPTEQSLRVRCRIDGVLFEQQAPPKQMHAAIISRLKIMADLDIAERRLPQDGRIKVTVHGRPIDLRVSTLPTTHGEKCVIRILDNRSIMVGLNQLGMWDDTLEGFRRQALQPYGIVLVTGPTGSGKSTTLYSALRIMDGKSMNLSTVEDPVEYELGYANQVNVHESIGLTFAAALRSLLRQDPDVIMVGEIRDEETARIAVQAALTGHLVLSTLHTNDAPSSITRLINIGIEPYLISAAVNAVLAQRLVRRVCDNCKSPVTNVSESVRKYLENYGADIETIYQGMGCQKCRQTGYKGRLGIYELLEMNEEIRDLISGNPSLGELRRASDRQGMRTLRDDGLAKVAAGMTTVEEVMKVTETSKDGSE